MTDLKSMEQAYIDDKITKGQAYSLATCYQAFSCAHAEGSLHNIEHWGKALKEIQDETDIYMIANDILTAAIYMAEYEMKKVTDAVGA